MSHAKYLISALIVALGCADLCAAQETMTIVSWNVESGDAHPDTVATRIAAMDGVDLWGLSEVDDDGWSTAFEEGAAVGETGTFEAILGTTGGNDRLLILFDEQQFELLTHFEIGWSDRYWYDPSMNPRSALVALFRHHDTGQIFFFMVNHLYRGSGVDPRRLDQAKKLRTWAAQQSYPIIAVGDYNFDWDLDPDDRGFNVQKGLGDMTAGGVFTWLEPVNRITTHDSAFNSILDFVFLANAEGRLTGVSWVVVAEGDFPETAATPDHRPVKAFLTIHP